MFKLVLLILAMAGTLLCLSFFAGIQSPEPWTDSQLPVKHGLVSWLDPSQQVIARKHLSLPAPESHRKLGFWLDGSGLAGHFRQSDVSLQPVYRVTYPKWAVGFADKNTFLKAALPPRDLKEATVVVYARISPKMGNLGAFIAANDTVRNQHFFSINAQKVGETSYRISASGAGIERQNSTSRQMVNVGDKFCATMVIDAQKLRLFLDGQVLENRKRTPLPGVGVNELMLGKSAANSTLGSFQGDVFEVLIYDRVLNDDERQSVERYLVAKYSAVVYVAELKSPLQTGGVPLETVQDAPLIQPLVPGFAIRMLPVQLANINVLRYRPDGRLYAGAYDGKIYLMRDTDGDGLEDQSSVYWESEDLKVITAMLLTPANYARGEGVFVATRGRILLILDKNGDNKGDTVVTVAEGWTPPERFAGGVSDALGLAMTSDGRLYFGLGNSDFTNAYLLDAATGKARYQQAGERGTIQELSADFSERKTVCTGVRFSVGLALNRQGDLFATEQEGATWLANGNPYDELLHIQTGRHYGFPPRHPTYLPSVVDEPSTFDYGPQHQSTVGLCFNEPLSAGGPVFGPSWWQGDALVAAMSRGKIYRTKLVKTSVGYVAKNETIAQLSRIIIDQAVSPKGHLTLTLHSGQPDWGTGPTGAGELWKLIPLSPTVPQPILTWSAGPGEIHIAFDQPLTAEQLANLQGNIQLTEGQYVQAGDRFEVMRPGYQAVRNQLATPRYTVPVSRLSLKDDDRTLVITTPERTVARPLGVTLKTNVFRVGEGPYAGQLDLLTDLTGVEAEWKAPSGVSQKTWLPHPDFTVSRELTAFVAAQKLFWNTVAGEGTVQLKGQLDLGQMLWPEIQPGSKLDWQYPTEQVTVVFQSKRPFQVVAGRQTLKATGKAGGFEAMCSLESRKGTWLAYNLTIDRGTGDPDVQVSWYTDRSAIRRPFPLRRVLVPYARPIEVDATVEEASSPQLAGGNWAKGKALFYGQAACALCHAIRGAGGKVGPDLTNLIYRDYTSVLRDIQEPNAAINPEHVAYEVTRKNGKSLTGVLLAENGNSISMGLIGGEVVDVTRSDIVRLKELETSLMPVGLDKSLTPTQLRDLMTFLLKEPGKAPPLRDKKRMYLQQPDEKVN